MTIPNFYKRRHEIGVIVYNIAMNHDEGILMCMAYEEFINGIMLFKHRLNENGIIDV